MFSHIVDKTPSTDSFQKFILFLEMLGGKSGILGG
jgi:hypothetical protein